MAASPVYGTIPNIGPKCVPLVANTTRDGLSGTLYPFYIAGPNGSIINQATLTPLGTNVAHVVRFFLKTGEVFQMIKEIAIPATAASETASQVPFAVPFNLQMEPAQEIHITRSAFTAGNAGVEAVAFGLDL